MRMLMLLFDPEENAPASRPFRTSEKGSATPCSSPRRSDCFARVASSWCRRRSCGSATDDRAGRSRRRRRSFFGSSGPFQSCGARAERRLPHRL